MVKYKTVKQFAAESGYTERAIYAKCSDGTWQEGQVWRRAPDKKPLISVEGYAEWVESDQASEQHQKAALKLVSCSTASNAVSASRLSPPPLT